MSSIASSDLSVSRSSGSVLERLRSETSHQHDEIESVLNLMRPDFSVPAYRKLLCRFFGFYASFEKRLAALPVWEISGFDLSSRLKTQALIRDLKYLELTSDEISQLPNCLELPSLTTLEESLGALYVVEGATLGGQFLSRHFYITLNLTAERGCAFFAGYGTHTRTMWKAFQETLVTVSHRSVSSEDQIVAAACETFDRFNSWMKVGL